MSVSPADRRSPARSQRPKATTVFAAAFLAGAAAAVGLNRTLDVHLAQRQPRVESEPIFVALRSLPQGAPVTVWDVALRDWPKAMLPAAAMRPRDSFEGMVLKHPLREGQPILSVQLAQAVAAGNAQVVEAAASTPRPVEQAAPQTDLWAPADVPAPATPPAEAVSKVEPAVAAPEAAAPESAVIEPATTDVVAVQPQSTETIAADAPVGEPAVAEADVAAPVITEPVVVAAPAATDIDPVVAPSASVADTVPAQTREPVVRYLVVPERIALEADRSFVQPPDTPSVAASETTAVAAPTQPSTPPVQTGRPTRPLERTSSSRDRQPQRPPRSAASQTVPTRQPEKASFLRSMLPSLSLGMGAAEPAAAPAESTSEPAGDQPARPAFRGFGLFR